MRICIFSPDMAAFEQHRLRQRVPLDIPGVELVLLTNSWGSPPADGTHVHVMAGARTLPMRALRWLLRDAARARLTRPVIEMLMRVVGEDFLEALRAADADLIVALDPDWIPHLCGCVRRHRCDWKCIGPDEAWPKAPALWRRYDPELPVSIVLPTFNGTRYLASSLESCLAQTHRRLEVIVVDDGSGPEVAELLRGFGDPRVTYLRHPVNRGLPAALNTGFAHTTGGLLTWTSDDNLYAPTAIEEMVRVLCTFPQVDFVYADASEIDADGRVVAQLRTPPPETLRVKNRVGGCFLYRRKVYETLGDYDASAVFAEDYDYWLRVAKRFTMQRLFRRLYYYRYHPASLTARCDRERVKRQAERVKRTHSTWWRTGVLRRGI